MVKEVTQNMVSTWLQPDGKGTALEIMSIDRHGVGDKTIPRSGRDLVSSRNAYGNPVIKKTVKTPPGGLITMNVEWTKIATPEFLETVARCNAEFGLWEFFISCGRLDNPSLYNRLDYYGGLGVTQQVNGAAPARDGTGTDVVNNVDLSGVYWVAWVPLELTLQTNCSIGDLFDIAGLKDCGGCFEGYPGPDEILYAVGSAEAVASPGDTADLMYTINGGGAWTCIGLGDQPFAAGEDIGDIEMMFISKTQYRLVVGRATVDGGNPAEIAWTNVTLGAPGTYAWTNVNVGAVNGQAIEALAWLFYDRLYTAAGGDIWISTNQAESFGAAAIYTGAVQINAFAKGPDDEVWAVGNTNLILRETGKSGTFETRTGPSGGGAFYSIAIANDGRVYAGNSQYIYVSTNAALNTGGWTQLKDFGANHTVVAIHLAGQAEVENGDSQLITAVVDNTAAGNGELWRSWDGGTSWVQVTEVTNVGYNAAYFSDVDDNLAIIVGDANATPMGVVHKASPCASC